MFVEITLSSPALKIGQATEARGWASTHLPSLPPIVFNRDETGRSISAGSPFFVRDDRRGAVVIGAVGGTATPTLLNLIGALKSEFDQACPGGNLHLRSGLLAVNTGAYLRRYQVFDFILQNHGRRKGLPAFWRASPDSPEVRAHLTDLAKELFPRQFEERCLLLGIEPQDDWIFGDFQIRPARSIPCGKTFRFAVHLELRSNLIFEGPWYVGAMANKGCGRVRRGREGA